MESMLLVYSENIKEFREELRSECVKMCVKMSNICKSALILACKRLVAIYGHSLIIQFFVLEDPT